MRRNFIFFITFFFVFPAFAQQIHIETECELLPDHIIEARRNGAEYVPGVDVNGNPIEPADLNSPLKSIEYPIEIPVEIDIIKWLSQDVPDGVALETDVANITLFEDGHTEYNGQDITSRIYYTCGDMTVEEGPGEEKADGQAPDNSISSKPQKSQTNEVQKGEIIEGEAQ